MSIQALDSSICRFTHSFEPRQLRRGDRPLVFFGGETDKEKISSPAVPVEHGEEFPATEVEIPAEFLDEITQGRVF